MLWSVMFVYSVGFLLPPAIAGLKTARVSNLFLTAAAAVAVLVLAAPFLVLGVAKFTAPGPVDSFGDLEILLVLFLHQSGALAAQAALLALVGVLVRWREGSASPISAGVGTVLFWVAQAGLMLSTVYLFALIDVLADLFDPKIAPNDGHARIFADLAIGLKIYWIAWLVTFSTVFAVSFRKRA